jgi:hypothetical protein
MTPGYKTTEFWLTLAATIAVTLQGLLAVDSPGAKIAAAVAAGLAAIGYTAARTITKVAE